MDPIVIHTSSNWSANIDPWDAIWIAFFVGFAFRNGWSLAGELADAIARLIGKLAR